MAYNPYDPYNQGIGTLDLGSFGLQQPEENMTVAEAINYGVLPQAKDTFTPEFPMGAKMNRGVKEFMKNNPTPTKASFVEALEAGKFGGATGGMFDKNVGTLFEGVPLDASFFSTEAGDVNPKFISPPGSFGGTIDIRKDQLSSPEDLPGGFFKSVGDQSSLGLPANDKYAMAISNYDQLFGPETMTDAFGTSYNISGAERPDMYTGLMNAKTGEALRDPFGPIGGITDRGRGMPGQGEMGAYEMIGGTPVAIGDVLGRQQALEKADFYEPSKKRSLGIDFNDILGLAALAYTGPYKGAVKVGSMFNNMRTGKLDQVLGKAKGIPAAFAKKMRGVDPYTGRVNTQADFDHNRKNRRTTNRINRISKTLNRWEANPTKYADQLKNTTLYDRRDNLRQQQNKSNIAKAKSKGVNISSLNPNEMRNVSETGSPGGNSGSSKIVCTMMNERYGFGSFRNKIWMKFHENHGPEYQKGYHTIFLPLVKIAKGEGKLNTAVRKVLEHMGRHVTADMFKIMKGKKRDTLGRIYRAIFEPTCRIIGKIKSALGRG